MTSVLPQKYARKSENGHQCSNLKTHFNFAIKVYLSTILGGWEIFRCLEPSGKVL